MYLTKEQLHYFFSALEAKFGKVCILTDIYTKFGARASKYRNPINDVGVTKVYGIDDIGEVTRGLKIRFVKEHTFTPSVLVNELKPADRVFFRMLFTGRTGLSNLRGNRQLIERSGE